MWKTIPNQDFRFCLCAWNYHTNTQLFLTTAMPQRCIEPSVTLSRLTPHTSWSSCFTLVFKNHPPLRSVAGDARCPPKGTLGDNVTLLETPPVQYLKWNTRLMGTQGTEMDIPSRENIWWHVSWLQLSLVVLVYLTLKKLNVLCLTGGNKVVLELYCSGMLARDVQIQWARTPLEKANSAKSTVFKIYIFLSNSQWGWWKGT